MTNTSREFMKGGANIHVKAHYRVHNGKLVYVHDHDKAGKIGAEAQLHERVQFGKNKSHLMALDPEDRDTVLKHAGQLGLKPEVKYQGGKIKNEEGESKAHGFHYLKFASEEDAKKVHESVTAASKGEAAPAQTEAPKAKEKPDPDNSDYDAAQKEAKQTAMVLVDKANRDLLMAAKSEVTLDFIKKVAESSDPSPSDVKTAIAHATKLNEIAKEGVKANQNLIKVAGYSAPVYTTMIQVESATRHVLKKLKAHEAKQESKPAVDTEDDDIEQSMGMPSPEEDAKGQINDLMAEAEANLHTNPAKAIDALKQGAALASKHGIKYSHSNGKEFDADYMNHMASQLEAAMPKPEPVDEKYAEAAKDAQVASSEAHGATTDALEAQKQGAMGPENASFGMKAHEAAGDKHSWAVAKHQKAGELAPTPELKAYHLSQAAKHDANATVHNEAHKVHSKQNKHNQAVANYNSHAEIADAASKKAESRTVNPDSHNDHGLAAEEHAAAAKAHTDMIQHALSADVHSGGNSLANKHAAKATEHQKKSDYHKAAIQALNASDSADVQKNEQNHKAAAAAHGEAMEKAKAAGMQESADKHEAQSKHHGEQAVKHSEFQQAHDKAMALGETANSSGTHKDHAAAAEAHNDAVHHAKLAYGEDDQITKLHGKLNKIHGEKASEAHTAENSKAPEPQKSGAPVKKETKGKYVGLKHEESAQAAEAATDIHQKILHYKHAALVALHNGDESQGMTYAKKVHQLQKEHGIAKSFDFDSFNAQAFANVVHEVARKLHGERNQSRNLSKAMKDLPSATKFYEACCAASYAGVDCLDDIIANAVGGKKSAAPYLHFLDNLK